MTKLLINMYMLCAAVCSTSLSTPTLVAGPFGNAPHSADAIPMHLEIDLFANHYFVGENFPITVRIVNPNEYDVYLKGFEFGPLAPHMEIAFPDQEGFQRFSLGGTISAIGGPPILIPAHESIEHRRLIYSGTKLDKGHWGLMPPGTYQLRMKGPVDSVTPSNPPRYKEVEWTSQVVVFTLTMPTQQNLSALEFLRQKASKLAERERRGDMPRNTLQPWLEMYSRFLPVYHETVYAPEIRWELVKLLYREASSQHSPLYNDPEMLDLFEECLTFCLDRGGAYSDEFISPGPYNIANGTIKIALRNNRQRLLKKIVRALDEKYPDDEESILYRRVLVVGVTESVENAKRVAATLTERFPNGEHTRSVGQLLKDLERRELRAKESPPKSDSNP